MESKKASSSPELSKGGAAPLPKILVEHPSEPSQHFRGQMDDDNRRIVAMLHSDSSESGIKKAIKSMFTNEAGDSMTYSDMRSRYG